MRLSRYLLAGCVILPAAAPAAPARTQVAHVEKSDVWTRSGDKAFYYESKLAVDADGAPNAYNPQNTGLDALSNAGRPGRWWALATDTGRSDGTPILQGPADPFPGYYVSMTSLEDTTKPRTDPHRFVDAFRVPFFVLPGNLAKQIGAKLGDFAYVINTRNGKSSAAIFADFGPETKLGEGSVALARALGIRESARVGGTDGGVVTIVFPGSGSGKPVAPEVVSREAERRFKKWGGLKRVNAEFPAVAPTAQPATGGSK